MSWAIEDGAIIKLDREEELDYVEIRLQKLESKDPNVRRKAAEALASYVEESNEFIVEVRRRFRYQPPHPAQVISDGIFATFDKNVLLTGAQALGKMGPPAAPYASKCLAMLMSNVDDEIRFMTARSLGYLGPGAAEEAAAEMGKRLDSEEETSELIRFTTARSLGYMGPAAAPHAAADLAAALEDKDADVQLACADALEKMGASAAPYATQKLVKALMGGSFELRRLACKALLSMGEACAEQAAYPMCRVLLDMQPCTPETYNGLRVLRQLPPVTCGKCKASGPFAAGTDYTSRKKSDNWNICKECYYKYYHKDVELQRLAAEALAAMGVDTVRNYQVYLSRALGLKDEGVKERVKTALKMAECDCALQGSMALYDKTPTQCGNHECPFCYKRVGNSIQEWLQQEQAEEDLDISGTDKQVDEEQAPEEQVDGNELSIIPEETQDDPYKSSDEDDLEDVFDDIKGFRQNQETLNEEEGDEATREPTMEEVEEDKDAPKFEDEASDEEVMEQPNLSKERSSRLSQEEVQEKWAGWMRDKEKGSENDKQLNDPIDEEDEEQDVLDRGDDYIATPRESVM